MGASFFVRRMVLAPAVALAALVAVAGTAPPPSIVLERVGAAASPDETAAIVSWTMRSTTVIEKPNGKARHEAEAVIETVREPGGVLRRKAIRFVRDGEDRTARLQETLDGEDRKGGPEGDGTEEGDADTEFLPPDAAHRRAYRFEPLPPTADGAYRCRLLPAEGHENDAGIMRGELAWDPESLDPLWIEGDVLHPPKPLKALHVRVEFRRVGPALLTVRVVSDGLAKFLLMKRRFSADIAFGDFELAPGGSPGGPDPAPAERGPGRP